MQETSHVQEERYRASRLRARVARSALDLERHISVPEAAALKGFSADTFRRHYGHLIRKVSPRRCTVKVRDLLAIDAA
jgi:hypothetical protein